MHNKTSNVLFKKSKQGKFGFHVDFKPNQLFCLPFKQTHSSFDSASCGTVECLSLWACDFLPFLISFPHGWDSFTIQSAECHKAQHHRDKTTESPKSNRIVTYFSYPAHIFQTYSPGGNWHTRPRYLDTELEGGKKTWRHEKALRTVYKGIANPVGNVTTNAKWASREVLLPAAHAWSSLYVIHATQL